MLVLGGDELSSVAPMPPVDFAGCTLTLRSPLIDRCWFLREAIPPSKSQTRSSSPNLLTETAFPRMPIWAPDIEEVWPQSLFPELMVSEDELDLTKYKERVLSG
jgi:hypothetical protein